MPLILDTQALAAAVDAHLPGGLTAGPLSGVAIDSRAVAPGDCFVGLPGTVTHGQRFAPVAFERGARVAIVEDAAAAGVDGRADVLVVPSAEAALRQAARAVRDRLAVPVVAITGTNGKTTTKDVVAAVLGQLLGPVHATRGNLNNHIGLPVSMLATPDDARAAVFELGMSNPGEIDAIAAIARPTIGMITNVGEAHLETMGSVEAIAAAKAELVRHIAADGVLVVNADCPWHRTMTRSYTGEVLQVGVTPSGGRRGLDAELTDVEPAVDHVVGRLWIRRDGDAVDVGPVRLPIPGIHVATSFLFASCAAVRLGASLEAVAQALTAAKPAWGRMQLRRYSGVRVIHDGYNANPASMAAALQHLAAVGGRTWAVLGGMLELGAASERAHLAVGEMALRTLTPERVRLFGACYRSVAGATIHETFEALADDLRPRLRPDDVLLIKASRGVGIERVLPLLFADADGS